MTGENEPESPKPTQEPATPSPDLADVPPAPTVMVEKAYGDREKRTDKGLPEKRD